jgi:hypothetical protein
MFGGKASILEIYLRTSLSTISKYINPRTAYFYPSSMGRLLLSVHPLRQRPGYSWTCLLVNKPDNGINPVSSWDNDLSI